MFSIIIPVYNVAAYLLDCINSILPALTGGDEVILSLGASSDSSTEICRKFAASASNIKLIWQNGTGLSNARNCAIEKASGTYIVCIDGDDYVETDAFAALLQRIRAEQWTDDLVVNDYYRLDRRTGRKSPFFQIGQGEDRFGMSFLPEMLKKHQCFWNVWRFIYRRQFLLELDIRYRENSLSEDVNYTTQVLLAARSVRFTHAPYYVYTVGRGESLMDRPTWKRLKDTVDILADSTSRLRSSDFPQSDAVVAQFQFEFLLNLALIYEIPKADRPAAAMLFQETSGVLTPATDQAVKLGAGGLKVLGIRPMAYGMHLLKKFKRILKQF